MTVSLKTKAVLICLLIFIAGFACGFFAKSILYNKSEYQFQHDFEKLEPLTKALGLSDVQKAILFNVLAEHKNEINDIMKQVDPKIKIQLHMMRENIRSILDENQKTIYARLLKEYEIRQIDNGY
ncbi:MAG: hypothetical protein LBL00_01075 [Endomicrobium sp.]|jgi:hypothetical protein|nr:hypothetical protein [Endomicrobium sp.]